MTSLEGPEDRVHRVDCVRWSRKPRKIASWRWTAPGHLQMLRVRIEEVDAGQMTNATAAMIP